MCIVSAVWWNRSLTTGSLSVKPGVDQELDEERRLHNALMDQTMGEVVLDITRVEMGILTKLTEVVLRNRSSMQEAVNLFGKLDCLLASKENNWTRPDMIDTGDLVIMEGRHPLQELSVTNFFPNSSWLGGEGTSTHRSQQICKA